MNIVMTARILMPAESHEIAEQLRKVPTGTKIEVETVMAFDDRAGGGDRVSHYNLLATWEESR